MKKCPFPIVTFLKEMANRYHHHRQRGTQIKESREETSKSHKLDSSKTKKIQLHLQDLCPLPTSMICFLHFIGRGRKVIDHIIFSFLLTEYFIIVGRTAFIKTDSSNTSLKTKKTRIFNHRPLSRQKEIHKFLPRGDPLQPLLGLSSHSTREVRWGSATSSWGILFLILLCRIRSCFHLKFGTVEGLAELRGEY